MSLWAASAEGWENREEGNEPVALESSRILQDWRSGPGLTVLRKSMRREMSRAGTSSATTRCISAVSRSGSMYV